jgi:hypothetical protein
MFTMSPSLSSAQVSGSGFGLAGQLIRSFSAALTARRTISAQKAALLDMDPRLLEDIGAARGSSAAQAGLATLSPGVLSASVFPASIYPGSRNGR